MNIVIAGGGKVGEVLCKELSLEGHNIVLIEKDQKILERIINKNDVNGLVGSATSYETQVDANVPSCDIFMAVTSGDEINIISAIIAKRLGATHTIARVRNPEYAGHVDFMREGLGITMMINPELEAAKDISRVIRYTEALSVEQFSNGRVNIVEIEANEKSGLADLPMSQFRTRFGNVLICAVSRDNSVFIPRGDSQLRTGDHIFVTGSHKDLTKLYAKTGLKQKKLRSAMIIGGGRVAYYLLDMLLEMNMELKIIENNPKVAKKLSEIYPRVVIVEGDGSDQEFLQEERIELYDTVISLTGVDEENLLISLFALNQGVKKVITKVNRTDLLKLMGNVGMHSIITPKRLIANEMIHFVRSVHSEEGKNVEALFRIADNQVEAIQFRVPSKSKVINKTLMELDTKENILIAYIVRNKKLIFPTGQDMMKPGDRVIVVTAIKALDSIEDILV